MVKSLKMRRRFDVRLASIMSEMRKNINVKEFLRDIRKKIEKLHSHAESSKGFGANSVFLSFNSGFNSLMNKILKIKESNFDLHFFRTENCLLTKSVFNRPCSSRCLPIQCRSKGNKSGGARERRRREPLGESGGILTQKILKSRGLEMLFPAFSKSYP